MIPLENVTIISINGRDPENSVKAINYSSRRIRFAKKILVTVPDKIQKYEGIEVFSYDIKNRDTYSYFCIKELYKYIDTDFCLLVQPDGFVVNPLMWSNRFFEYDYIGAPHVPGLVQAGLQSCGKLKEGQNQTNLPHKVGCGGFTLRSKKFLFEASKLNYPPVKIYNHNTLAEDFFLCVDKKEELEKKGIKFASLDVAFRFAVEWGAVLDRKAAQSGTPIRHNGFFDSSFGFHGKHPKPAKDFLISLIECPENEKELDVYRNLSYLIKE